jgi:hypothetical protein
MNPKIKKFWEDAGYEITSLIIWDKDRNDLRAWHIHVPPIHANHKIVARYYEIDGKLEIRYFLDVFDGHVYTEDEMLKIIKMKMFI